MPGVEDRAARSRRRCPGSCAVPAGRRTARATRPARRRRSCTAGLRAFSTCADAGDRAAGADAGHEDVHLRRRCRARSPRRWCAGGLGVGRVLELLGHEVVGVARRPARRPWRSRRACPRRRASGRAGAVGLQQVAPLDAHRLGHGEDQPVALAPRHTIARAMPVLPLVGSTMIVSPGASGPPARRPRSSPRRCGP